MKKIKVVYRKLGKERVWAWCHSDCIELDVRLKGKKKLEMLVHESLHYLFRDLTENEVIKASVLLTNTLWAEHIRPVDNDTSVPLQKVEK